MSYQLPKGSHFTRTKIIAPKVGFKGMKPLKIKTSFKVPKLSVGKSKVAKLKVR